jgi:phosphate-selective porin OprO/OprP
MLNGNFLIRDSTYAIAFLRDTDEIGEGFSNREDYRITARLTRLPYFEDGGTRLLHLEFSYSHQFADEAAGTRFQAAPANDFAPSLVDTGDLALDGVDLFNFGAAWVEGSLSLQGEVMWVLASQGIPEDAVFWGAYAELSWWLTGEHRRYLRGRGVFSRVVPNNRFDPEKGVWGAFEIATRYSWLDLSNDGIRGGTLGEWSAALNWVLLSNLRVSTNYVLAHTGDRPGTRSGIAHSWVTRFQVDF